VSLFDEDTHAWLALLFSLPPIDLAACARQQKEAKERLLAKRDAENMRQIVSLMQAVDELSGLVDHEMAVCYSLHGHEATERFNQAEELRLTRNSLSSMLDTEISGYFKTTCLPQKGAFSRLNR